MLPTTTDFLTWMDVIKTAIAVILAVLASRFLKINPRQFEIEIAPKGTVESLRKLMAEKERLARELALRESELDEIRILVNESDHIVSEKSSIETVGKT